MKIALRTILYDEKPLIWEYDPEKNEAVCSIPAKQKKAFREAFQYYPGITLEKKILRLSNVREFIGQNPLLFVIAEDRFINTDMAVLDMLLSQIAAISASYAADQNTNSSIESKLDEFLQQLPSLFLSSLYTELQKDNILIARYPVIARAITKAWVNSDSPRGSSVASSSNATGPTAGEINDLLLMLSRDASAYAAIEQVMVDYLAKNSNYFDLIAHIIGQDASLKSVGDGAWTRALQLVETDMSASLADSSSSISSLSTSVYSLSGRESPLFFAKKIHPTQSLRLDDIMDRDNQSESEFRQTFIHEEKQFLAIAENANAAMQGYPIHTADSFNISVTTLEKNIAVYTVKHLLLKEIRQVFDDTIDPLWRLGNFDNTPTLHKAISAWFKTAALDIMKTLPERGETKKQWHERVNSMMNKLLCLTSDKISIKKMELDEHIGETLEKLKRDIRENPNKLKELLKDTLKQIRKYLEQIGDIEFQARKQSMEIAQLTEKRRKIVRNCYLFSGLLSGVLKQYHPKLDNDGLLEQISQASIHIIKRCNDAFISLLTESGLQPENEQFVSVIKTPSSIINGYSRRFLSDYFYVGEPLATKINEELHKIASNPDLTAESLLQKINDMFAETISGLLADLFAEPLATAQALSAGSSPGMRG